MKNYSFSNIAAQDSYITRKSNDLTNCYRHSELKVAEANQRIEEIKKKYDTPSRRDRIDSMKKSRDFCAVTKLASKDQSKQNQGYSKEEFLQPKESYTNHRNAPAFGHNHLKQSFAVNRLEKSTLKNDINNKEIDCMRGNENDYHRRSYDQRQSNLYSLKSQSRQDEQILFSKVREMKESIINNDYMRGSTNGRTSISSAKYSQLPETKPDMSKQFDPRVENIDKINAKIKQILNCLAQNEKNPPKFMKDNQTSLPPKESVLISTKADNIRASYLKNDRSANKYENTKDSAVFGVKSRDFQDSTYKNRLSSNVEAIKDPNFSSKSPQNLQKITGISPYSIKNERLTSNINSFKPESLEQNNQRSLSFNKLGSQIEKPKLRQYRDYSVNKVESYLQSQGASKKEQELIRTPTYMNSRHFQTKSGLRTSQSRSHIDSIRKSTLTDNEKSDVLKSGKKLNEEISKIQKKIQEFEAEKKKLNMQFTPFSMKNRSSSNLAAGARLQPSAEIVKRTQQSRANQRSPAPYFQGNKVAREIKLNYQAGTGAYEKRQPKTREYANEQISKSSNIDESETNPNAKEDAFQLRLEQVDIKTVRIDKNTDANQEISINASQHFEKNNEEECSASASTIPSKPFMSAADEAAIRKRTDDGIQQRRKRLQTSDQIIKTDSLKKLISLFCEQAKLDENFRNMKIWLESNFSSDKYQTLSRLLSKERVTLNLRECQALFKVEESEHNPFFTTQGFDGSFEAVVKAYLEASRHWQNRIMNKFDKQNLLSEGFTSNRIDLERKGFIELEDIVRLLNIQSGTFYRNRDIFLVFRRFTLGDRVNFDNILSEICV